MHLKFEFLKGVYPQEMLDLVEIIKDSIILLILDLDESLEIQISWRKFAIIGIWNSWSSGMITHKSINSWYLIRESSSKIAQIQYFSSGSQKSSKIA